MPEQSQNFQDPMMGTPNDPIQGGEMMPPQDDGQFGQQPAGMEQPQMDGPENDEMNVGGDNVSKISAIFNEITPKDQEAVISYAESKKETTEQPPMGGEMEQGMMLQNESIVLTKAQVKKINEQFMGDTDRKNEKKVQRQKKNNFKKTPFDNPTMN